MHGHTNTLSVRTHTFRVNATPGEWKEAKGIEVRGSFHIYFIHFWINVYIWFFFFSASTTLVCKRHRYIDTRAQRESAPLRRTEETRACPASVDPLVWFVFPRGRSAPTSSPRPPATPEEGGGTAYLPLKLRPWLRVLVVLNLHFIQ